MIKLQGCSILNQHYVRCVCFAKDLASLTKLDATCPTCQIDLTVTIHDTDCQDTVMDEGSIPIDATKITGRFRDEEDDNHAFSTGLSNR